MEFLSTRLSPIKVKHAQESETSGNNECLSDEREESNFGV
jgi:hypothetical protein